MALSDLTNPDALEYAQRRLEKLGVDRALARAGVGEGELVRVGSFVFEYQRDDQVLMDAARQREHGRRDPDRRESPGVGERIPEAARVSQ